MPRGSQQASFGARRGIGERLAVAGGTRGVCSGVCLPRSPQGSGKSCTLRCRRCRPLCSLASPSCATCSCSKGRVTHAGHVQGESSIGPCQLRRNTAGVPIPRHSDGPASATLHGPRCGAGCCGKEGSHGCGLHVGTPAHTGSLHVRGSLPWSGGCTCPSTTLVCSPPSASRATAPYGTATDEQGRRVLCEVVATAACAANVTATREFTRLCVDRVLTGGAVGDAVAAATHYPSPDESLEVPHFYGHTYR